MAIDSWRRDFRTAGRRRPQQPQIRNRSVHRTVRLTFGLHVEVLLEDVKPADIFRAASLDGVNRAVRRARRCCSQSAWRRRGSTLDTLITADAGTVIIAGTPTTGMRRGELTTLRRNKIGIVFQQTNLLPSLTAAEQLQVVAQSNRRSPGKARGGPWSYSTPWA